MKVAMRIVLGLAIFVLIAGLVYYISSNEWRGSVMLIVLGVAFGYIALVFRGAVKRASAPVTAPKMVEEEVAEAHVGPTIWPFVFSLAPVLLVIGVVGVHWMLIPGVILLVGAAVGWFLDIEHQWHPTELHAVSGAVPERGSTPQGEQHADESHRE